MKLTPRQRSELTALKSSRAPLWGGCPPEKYSDADISYYQRAGLVEWVGDGYRITQVGLSALAEQEKAG